MGIEFLASYAQQHIWVKISTPIQNLILPSFILRPNTLKKALHPLNTLQTSMKELRRFEDFVEILL